MTRATERHRGARPQRRRSAPRRGARAAVVAITLVCCAGGCASTAQQRKDNPAPTLPEALVREARQIGRGPRFQPPVAGPVLGRCRHRLGPRVGVHVELFAANKVVLVPSAIGTTPPRAYSEGRVSSARCYGDLVTVEPTGVVLVRSGVRRQLSDLFRSWGQPLARDRLASFAADHGGRVRVFVDGHGWPGAPGSVPLAAHREIVLEVGPFVPPHSRYAFPPGT